MPDIYVSVPVRCVQCGYPKQFGATIYAEVKCNPKEQFTAKEWKCPVCNASKTIQVSVPQYKENKVSRFAIYSPKKVQEVLEPGRLQKIND